MKESLTKVNSHTPTRYVFARKWLDLPRSVVLSGPLTTRYERDTDLRLTQYLLCNLPALLLAAKFVVSFIYSAIPRDTNILSCLKRYSLLKRCFFQRSSYRHQRCNSWNADTSEREDQNMNHTRWFIKLGRNRLWRKLHELNLGTSKHWASEAHCMFAPVIAKWISNQNSLNWVKL